MSKRNPYKYNFQYDFSVGVLPAGTLGGQSENVWWIAAGNTASTSTSARGGSPGQVYMLDMTKSAFSKCNFMKSNLY